MTARLISDIRVEGLFGLYTYVIPVEGELTDAAILYGDNGVGKSTLLRLVFHLLSAADNRGHRQALYATDFRRLEVNLSSGVKLTASVAKSNIVRGNRARNMKGLTHVIDMASTKTLMLEVFLNGKRLAVWDYRPKGSINYQEDEDFVIEISSDGNSAMRRLVKSARAKEFEGIPFGEKAYLEALKSHVPTLFILNAERRLDSDSVADPSDEVELRRTMQYGEPKKINELVARSREIALSQALNTAARWISRKAVLGTNRGSMNVHSVYEDVLRRLVSPSTRVTSDDANVSTNDLLKQLAYIDTKTNEHARYEFSTHLPTNDFRKALSARSAKKAELAAELLKPYIKSVEGRLEAVEPIYQLCNRFITIVNGLLFDKTISFKLSQGFTIKNKLGFELKAAQLSSGEQQLLLLFCYVLTARDTAAVFMIDEPEISLNIKWQRRLVQSLLDLTDEGSIQFIFASHSMELLAQHRDRVVKLVSQS